MSSSATTNSSTSANTSASTKNSSASPEMNAPNYLDYAGVTSLLAGLQSMQSRDQLCDITLVIDGHRIKCHRLILAAVSPYFHSMFTSGMQEVNQTEVEFHAIDGSIMQLLIDYAYSFKLDLTSDNVQGMMTGANFLQIKSVEECCAQFMLSDLQVSNAIGTFNLAQLLNCKRLEDGAMQFIRQNFREISQTDDFHASLPGDQLISFLSRKDLNVPTEKEVYKAAMRWLNTDLNSRKEFVEPILSNVFFPSLPLADLEDLLANPLVSGTVSCEAFIKKALTYHKEPHKRRELIRDGLHVGLRSTSWDPNEFLCDVYVTNGEKSDLCDGLNSIEVLDPIVLQWNSIQVADNERKSIWPWRSDFSMANVGKKLLAIGGTPSDTDDFSVLPAVEEFCPANQKWVQIGRLQIARKKAPAVSLNNRSYIFGGTNEGDSAFRICEYYNPDTDMWSPLTSLSVSRGGAAVAVLNGNIYVIGGHGMRRDGTPTYYSSVECYEPDSDSWTNVSSMHGPRYLLGAATLAGKIYACGGFDGSQDLNTVECYNPKENEWALVACMNVRRCNVAVVANCGRLIAIGGCDGSENLSSTEIYNPDSDTWTMGPDMILHKGAVAAGLVPMVDENEAESD